MSMSFFIYTDENFQGQLGESVFSQSCTECKNWTFFCEVCVYVFFLLLIVLISLIFWWNYLDHNRENRVGNYFYDYVVSSHKEAASFYTYHFELIFIDPNVIHYNSLPPFYIGTISPFIHWTPHHRKSPLHSQFYRFNDRHTASCRAAICLVSHVVRLTVYLIIILILTFCFKFIPWYQSNDAVTNFITYF